VEARSAWVRGCREGAAREQGRAARAWSAGQPGGGNAGCRGWSAAPRAAGERRMDGAAAPAAGGGPVEPWDWAFLQCFGERSPGEDIQEGARALRSAPPEVLRSGGWPWRVVSYPRRAAARACLRTAQSALRLLRSRTGTG